MSIKMSTNNDNSHLLGHLSTRYDGAFSNNAASKVKTDYMPPGSVLGVAAGGLFARGVCAYCWNLLPAS